MNSQDTYEAPDLVVLGQLAEITQSGGGVLGDALGEGDLLSFVL